MELNLNKINEEYSNVIINKVGVFNEDGNDEYDRQLIIGGNPTGIANMNTVRHRWATRLYDQMVGNFWIPQTVDMTDDKRTKDLLLDHEKQALYDTLGFLIFMDSFQVANLPNIADVVTSPIIKLCLGIQVFQEGIHTQSYQYIAETLLPTTERDAIYDRWKENPILRERIKHIADIANAYIENPTLSNFYKIIIANYILEGLYFYQGFNFFDQLSHRNKLVQCSKQIDFIRRDEHCFDDQTEILTDKGWKLFKDLIKGEDKVAQYNKDKSIDFILPTHYVEREYKGQLVNFSGRYFDISVTPEHRMIFANKTEDNLEQLAKDFNPSFSKQYYCSGYKTSGNLTELSPLEQLLIAYQADGSLSTDVLRTGERSGTKSVVFYLKKERKVNRLESILSKLDFSYSKNISVTSGYTSFNIKIPLEFIELFTKDFDWVDISEATYIWADHFLQELVHWDGYLKNKEDLTNLYYSNTNKKAVDVVQTLAVLGGYSAHMSTQEDNRKETYSDIYRLFLHKDNLVRCTGSNNKEITEYSGNIYCVTVPSGMILVRKNNKVIVSGNCHKGIFINIIKEIGIDDALIISMFKDAVKTEIQWCHHVYGDRIMGISKKSSEAFVKSLANDCLNRLGIPSIFEGVSNPYKHLELSEKQGGTRENFFEQTVTSYDNAGSLPGWDLI